MAAFRRSRSESALSAESAACVEPGAVALGRGVNLGSFGRNVRFALRQLRLSPGFAITAVLALALGIGPHVAIFSIIWATFLAPLPYPDANQLVVVWTHYKGERSPTRAEDYAQYAAQSQSFQRIDFVSWRTLHLTNPDHTEDAITGSALTPGFYSHNTRLHMQLGRDFLPDEGLPGHDHMVMLTYRLWTERYHGDPNVLGKAILIDDQPYTVIGVLQPVPTDKNGAYFVLPVVHPLGVKSDDFGNVFCRLKPGVTLAQAQAEMSLIDQRIAQQRNGGKNAAAWSVSVEQLKNDWLDHKLERNLWLLLASVSLVLLIACANVANLLLARGASRRQELAVRAALGATRRQVFVQLLTESLNLAALGGAIGIAMGWVIMKLSMSILPLQNMTAEADVSLNLPVTIFAILISLIAGVAFGCAPGWQAARLNLGEVLKQGSRAVGGRTYAPIQSVLVTVEIALALVLLAGAGMALHSFWNLSHVDLGFNSDHLLTGVLVPKVSAPQGGRKVFPPAEQIVVQQRQLLERMRAVPGVAQAALATNLPLHGFDNFSFSVAGQPVDQTHLSVSDFDAVAPSYFNTMGIRLVRGRLLNENDTLTSPLVVVVNETFVRRFLQSRDPLTQRLLMPHFGPPGASRPPAEYQVVGVFHDVLDDQHATGVAQPEMYISLWQSGWPYVVFALHTAGDPAVVTAGLRTAVSSANPALSLEELEEMQHYIATQRVSDRFSVVLFDGFAAVALLLAAVGIYGVMAFSVAQRTHEIGVRMALGAGRSEVVALIVRGGIRLALVGVGAGLIGAFLLGRLMRSTLYGVQSADWGSLAAVAALLLAVAALASWLPARRSAVVDPMQALRNE